MAETKRWQDARVGKESPQMAVRVTEEEKERLEALRRKLRLTSKGQVIRAALDVLERSSSLIDMVTGADVEEGQRVMRRTRRALGVPTVDDLQAAPMDDAVAINKDLKTSYKYVVGGPDGADGGLPDGGAAGPPQEEAA